MNQTPFEIAKGVGDRIGNAQERQSDLSALDQILQEATETGDPKIINSSIGQILSRVSKDRQGPALQYLQNRSKELIQESQFARKQQGVVDKQVRDQRNLEDKRRFQRDNINLKIAADRKNISDKQDFKTRSEAEKSPLTPNEELNQIRSSARQKTANLLAPFRNAFGGLELASKEKRKELAGQLKEIQDSSEKQIATVSKRRGIQTFDQPSEADEIGQDEDTQQLINENENIQQLINELEEEEVLTREIAAAIFEEAGKDGLKGEARKAKARELAKQKGY